MHTDRCCRLACVLLSLAFAAGCEGTVVSGGPSSVGPDAPDAGTPIRPLPLLPGARALDPQVLHYIDVTVDPQHLAQLEEDRDNRVPCTIVFDGFVLEQSGIRQKGGIGSVSDLQGKPGFSVKFDQFVPRQRHDGLKKIILNNAIQDPSLVSEPLGYAIYRAAGIPAPRTAHAIVSLNGFTYGIYVLVEAVDGQFLERSFGAGNHKGNLYEGPYLVDFVEEPEELELKDEVEENRSRDDIFALAALIRDTPDGELAAALASVLDVDGFIRSYALDALLVHWDGYAFAPNNYYLYSDPGTGRFVHLPHGMDQLLQYEADPFERPKGAFARRLRGIPELDARFTAAVHELAESAWDMTALHAQIDAVARVVHSTTSQEPRVLEDLEAFDDNVAFMKDMLEKRRASGLPRP